MWEAFAHVADRLVILKLILQDGKGPYSDAHLPDYVAFGQAVFPRVSTYPLLPS